ncbi:hypothetical protein BaRGS_00030137 [Batillaria attramentaria]|uniref:Uncharacterized protein n=1 Tax=Batillaria attramentaria TaxID=370345 RepID=A0ABD0JVD9_9CAEN
MAARLVVSAVLALSLLQSNLLSSKVSADTSAADDTSCTSQHALDTGRQLAERFATDGELSREGFSRLLADVAHHLQVHSLADLGKYCAQNEKAEEGGMAVEADDGVNCSQLLIQVIPHCNLISVLLRVCMSKNVAAHISAKGAAKHAGIRKRSSSLGQSVVLENHMGTTVGGK